MAFTERCWRDGCDVLECSVRIRTTRPEIPYAVRDLTVKAALTAIEKLLARSTLGKCSILDGLESWENIVGDFSKESRIFTCVIIICLQRII